MAYWFIMIESSKMFIIFLLICAKIAIVTNSENYCRNRNFNNKEGICKSIYQCTPLFKLLENRPVSRKSIEILNKSLCGFSGLIPKVCCFSNEDDNNNITVLSTDATLRHNGIKCGQFAEDRIYNGNTAALDQYPWDALLVYKTKNGTKFQCAGVLISEKYVLTAAHCLNDELMSVRLGEHNIQTNPDCESWSSDKFCLPPFLEVLIQDEIPHESYKPENHHENDIALLRLKSKVVFSDFVAPVCLPGPEDTRRDFRNGRLVMTAWGIYGDQMKYMEKKTMSASVQNSSFCDFGNFSLNLTLKQVCVKSAERFCVDDSGGAAVDISTRTLDFYYYVAGILSFGSCNVRNQARVYTRVDQYRNWISNKMKL